MENIEKELQLIVNSLVFFKVIDIISNIVILILLIYLFSTLFKGLYTTNVNSEYLNAICHLKPSSDESFINSLTHKVPFRIVAEDICFIRENKA